MSDPPVILFDVNIILDVLAQREPFFRDSAALLVACEAGRCHGVIAAHGVTTLANLLRKRIGETAVRDALASLLGIVSVVAVDQAIIELALTSRIRDFEDAVQMAAAVAARARYVATRDFKGFKDGPIPAAAPADLVPALLHL